jgi:hypothetical protein
VGGALGLDPDLRDAEAFSAADREGLLGAYMDEELEGTVSAVRYGGGFGGTRRRHPRHAGDQRGRGRPRGHHGMTPVFETARLYRGVDPVLPAERIFGFTGFELG